MYVCVCNAVTERQIKRAYSEGACSMRALREQLGVAGCCGCCAPAAREVLRRCQAEDAERERACTTLLPVLPEAPTAG